MTTHQETDKLNPEDRSTMISYFKERLVRLRELENWKGGDPDYEVTEQESKSFQKQLESYSDELLSKMHAAYANNSHPALRAFTYAAEGKSEAYIHTYCIFREAESKRVLFTESSQVMPPETEYIDSLATYPQLQYEHTSKYYQKAIALAGTVHALQNHEDIVDDRFITYTQSHEKSQVVLARVTNDDLADLILEYPEQWKEIAELITVRKTDNADLLRAILSNDARAIREGTL